MIIYQLCGGQIQGFNMDCDLLSDVFKMGKYLVYRGIFLLRRGSLLILKVQRISMSFKSSFGALEDAAGF